MFALSANGAATEAHASVHYYGVPLVVLAPIESKNIKETPSQVRVFALAGAIGIEPTQWESEAQVLPLHQAPSRWLLYITHGVFCNRFCPLAPKNRNLNIIFKIVGAILLQKFAN